MKQIDKYLITSFIPPFIVTFFIALFVLIMQFLWTYIDDIVGKGAGLGIIMEIIFYLSISLFPMALPIAILISSVMVMGNLAERYEIASFKSAGIPLMRVMLPLLYVAIAVAGFSYICSNYLIPIANLKFKSRLYDIRKQKPTLSLEEGVFNEDFTGFVIHIGKKGEDNKSIEDVLIYDHNNYTEGMVSQIVAKKGEMYTSDDQQFFIMNLFDGWQYQEQKDAPRQADKTYPFIRTSFKEWNKVFDLGQFDLNRTDEGLFKSHHTMMSTRQLSIAIDSIYRKIDKRENDFTSQVDNYFHFRRKLKPEVEKKIDKAQQEKMEAELLAAQKLNKKMAASADSSKVKMDSLKTAKDASKKRVIKKGQISGQMKREPVVSGKIYMQNLDEDIICYRSILETFKPKDQKRLLNRTQSTIRSIHGHSKSFDRFMKNESEKLVKHIYELHIKYSMAVICIIFLFVGAPMGAIVRKGGFGYPIIIAIIFFMLFMVLTIFCDKLAEQHVLPAVAAAWIPCGILLPIGLFLTYKAMNDSKVLNVDKISNWFNKYFNKSNYHQAEVTE